MYANLVETSSKSSKARNANSKSGLFPPTRAHSNNDARKMIFSNSLDAKAVQPVYAKLHSSVGRLWHGAKKIQNEYSIS